MESIINFVKSIWSTLLKSLGLLNKEGTLLLLGLDNAGKTTLLHRLQQQQGNNKSNTLINIHPPTDRPYQSNKFICENITFQAWDLGGHEAVRHLWEDYICECSAILFLIDASDNFRLEEAEYELDLLLGENIITSQIPVAILLNKCDLPTALSSKDILDRIKYKELQKMHASTTSEEEETTTTATTTPTTSLEPITTPNNYEIQCENDEETTTTNGNLRPTQQQTPNGSATPKRKSKTKIIPKQQEEEVDDPRMSVFRISVLRGEGYQQAFQWISQFL